MEYKGYFAKAEFDDEANIFHGEVINLRDVITFEGATVDELRKAFQDSVDDYLEYCAERGEDPDKPYSGRFIVRVDLNRLQNPQLMLGSFQDIVIIDEIQIMPELFNVLRVLVDRPENKTRFLILRSSSPDLVKNASQSLAGRFEFIELSGFGLHETGTGSTNVVWLRGRYPSGL